MKVRIDNHGCGELFHLDDLYEQGHYWVGSKERIGLDINVIDSVKSPLVEGLFSCHALPKPYHLKSG